MFSGANGRVNQGGQCCASIELCKTLGKFYDPNSRRFPLPRITKIPHLTPSPQKQANVNTPSDRVVRLVEERTVVGEVGATARKPSAAGVGSRLWRCKFQKERPRHQKLLIALIRSFSEFDRCRDVEKCRTNGLNQNNAPCGNWGIMRPPIG